VVAVCSLSGRFFLLSFEEIKVCIALMKRRCLFCLHCEEKICLEASRCFEPIGFETSEPSPCEPI